MRSIYLFSGLGADNRVFKNLDFTGFEISIIRWIPPFPRESIGDYSQRISKQITTPRPILLGVSFGGMMAIEVAKHIETEKIVIISSARTKAEIPFYFKAAGLLRLHRLIPSKLLLRPSAISNWAFGPMDERDRSVLATILRDTDPAFFTWAIQKIVSWKNKTVPANLCHIHGTSDRILPHNFAKSDFSVTGGGHFMVFNRSEEINSLIRSLLKKLG